MTQKKKSIRFADITEWLSRPAMVFYIMPFLMLLLIAGTLAQADMGLYEAHKKFFASFIFFLGPVPLPGGYLILALLSFNLVLKFLFYSEWRWRKSGIILAHLGALVLLIGGLLTAIFAREGYMVIAEGQQSPYVYDYHARELTIYKDDQAIYTIPYDDLQPNMDFSSLGLPFEMNILASCGNCNISKREEVSQGYSAEELQGMSRFMALESKPRDKNEEANLSGLTMRISGASEEASGIYIAFEGMPKPIELNVDGHNYKMVFGKVQRELPFQIALKDFVKEDYMGTQMAKNYHSDVTVLDGGAHWQARVEMNAPLRYKGYTFYQSSFDQSGPAEMTVLSVVQNKGRIFPYLGTLIIAAGLILHMLIVFRQKNKERS